MYVLLGREHRVGEVDEVKVEDVREVFIYVVNETVMDYVVTLQYLHYTSTIFTKIVIFLISSP